MITLTETSKLQIVMDSAPTTNNPDVVVTAVDVGDGILATPLFLTATTIGATVVDILDSPAAGIYRQLKFLSVCNVDTDTNQIFIIYDDNGTDRIIWQGTLAIGDTLQYNDGEGFSVIDTLGGRKSSPFNPYLYIDGTDDQITVTDNGDGTITLSTPQDIDTGATPTFAGLTLNSTSFPALTINGPSSHIELHDTDDGQKWRIGANLGYLIVEDENTGLFPIFISAGCPTNTIRVNAAGNIALGGSTYDATATKTLILNNGTAPAAGIANGVQLYSVDRAAGKAGLGIKGEDGTTTVISDHIQIDGSDPVLFMSNGSSRDLTIDADKSAVCSFLYRRTSGTATIDIDPVSDAGTDPCSFRFFRTTNTSGSVYFDGFKGDGSGTSNFRLAGNINSYVCADNSNFGIRQTSFDGTGVGVLAIGNGTPPAAGLANAVQFYSKDLSAGNTMLGIRFEGTGQVGSGTPTQNRTIAMEINGVTLYILASTSAA